MGGIDQGRDVAADQVVGFGVPDGALEREVSHRHRRAGVPSRHRGQCLPDVGRRQLAELPGAGQSSIIRFVEGNWRLGRLGDQSPGASSATLDGMFDFRHPHHSPFILDPASGHQHSADALRA